MNNAQLINNIKTVCKQKNIPLGIMLESCNLSKGFIYDVEKRDRTPSIDKISAISEYLGVSVDYLLGRVSEPTGYLKVTYPVETPPKELKTGDNVGNNNNSSVNINSSKEVPKFDETTTQVAEMFSKLDLIDKTKVLSLMVELSEKNK
jgi:transcriptional regulator with XRE-family HTH domain